MATTISKINVYKNNEWENYPISTTAQNVVTTDGNLTNTISSINNRIDSLTNKIIHDLPTDIEGRLPITGGVINGDLGVANNLTTHGTLTINRQVAPGVSQTVHGINLKNENIIYGNTPPAVIYDEEIWFQAKDGAGYATIRSRQLTNGSVGLQLYVRNKASSTDEWTKLSNSLTMDMSTTGVASIGVNQPEAWRAALGIATVSKRSITVSEYNGTIELVKYADGLVTCDAVLPNFPSATTTSANALIPSGYRPKESKYNIWGAGMDRNNALRGFGLASDGSIKGYYSTNEGLWFHVVYYA